MFTCAFASILSLPDEQFYQEFLYLYKAVLYHKEEFLYEHHVYSFTITVKIIEYLMSSSLEELNFPSPPPISEIRQRLQPTTTATPTTQPPASPNYPRNGRYVNSADYVLSKQQKRSQNFRIRKGEEFMRQNLMRLGVFDYCTARIMAELRRTVDSPICSVDAEGAPFVDPPPVPEERTQQPSIPDVPEFQPLGEELVEHLIVSAEPTGLVCEMGCDTTTKCVFVSENSTVSLKTGCAGVFCNKRDVPNLGFILSGSEHSRRRYFDRRADNVRQKMYDYSAVSITGEVHFHCIGVGGLYVYWCREKDLENSVVEESLQPLPDGFTSRKTRPRPGRKKFK